MSKGFLWIAQNNEKTDYMKLSVSLCQSIKKYCKNSQVCVITDKSTKAPDNIFDHVIVLEHDDSAGSLWKMSNEWKVFHLSPFIHTIKLEADMLVNSSLDWWWNYLCQYDMVFSYHCRDYQDNIVVESPYRKLFRENRLPDVYNGLHYFRRSVWANRFFNLCRMIIKNWIYVKENILINCHDSEPTTDVVYALANKIMDPLQLKKINFEWFNFIHGKSAINQIPAVKKLYNYVTPYRIKDKLYLGSYPVNRIWHYHDKNILDEIDERTF